MSRVILCSVIIPTAVLVLLFVQDQGRTAAKGPLLSVNSVYSVSLKRFCGASFRARIQAVLRDLQHQDLNGRAHRCLCVARSQGQAIKDYERFGFPVQVFQVQLAAPAFFRFPELGPRGKPKDHLVRAAVVATIKNMKTINLHLGYTMKGVRIVDPSAPSRATMCLGHCEDMIYTAVAVDTSAAGINNDECVATALKPPS